MSVSTYDPSLPAVTMTMAAQAFFETKLSAQPEKIIRLSTQVSGCTGYAYVLDLADAPDHGDEILKPSDKIVLAIAGDA